MRESTKTWDSSGARDMQEMSRWARVYAQNRTLGFIVFQVGFVLLAVAIGGSSYLAGKAYLDRNTPLFVACIVVLVLAMAAVVYCSIPWWGGRRLEQMTKDLYEKEGSVTIAVPHSGKRKVVAAITGVSFGVCILASVLLGMFWYIPPWCMQPISALYVVPFLVILFLLMRPAVGLAMLLWPVLYALHAILILAGVPILFTGKWEGLNMLLPIAGYGLLAGVVGHIRSRTALRHLRQLAQADQSSVAGL